MVPFKGNIIVGTNLSNKKIYISNNFESVLRTLTAASTIIQADSNHYIGMSKIVSSGVTKYTIFLQDGSGSANRKIIATVNQSTTTEVVINSYEYTLSSTFGEVTRIYENNQLYPVFLCDIEGRIFINNNEILKLYYNGTRIKNLYLNGKQVFSDDR